MLVRMRSYIQGSRPLYITAAIVGLFAAITAALIPFAQYPLPQTPTFVTFFSVGFFLMEGMTGLLILIAFRNATSWALLLLGCAYLFSAFMSLSQLVTFPGAIFAGHSLLNVNPQTPSWLFAFWINGFAALSFLSVIAETFFDGGLIKKNRVYRVLAASIVTLVFAILLVVFASHMAGQLLPPLITDNQFTFLTFSVRWPALILAFASLILIFTSIRERNTMYLWLAVAITAFICHNLLSEAGGGRYTLGWIAGRVSWLTSAFVLLIYFFFRFSRQEWILAQARNVLLEPANLKNMNGAAVPLDETSRAIAIFVARENIERYRKKLRTPGDEDLRHTLEMLLAEEESKLQILSRH